MTVRIESPSSQWYHNVGSVIRYSKGEMGTVVGTVVQCSYGPADTQNDLWTDKVVVMWETGELETLNIKWLHGADIVVLHNPWKPDYYEE